MSLNIRQQRFVASMIAGSNATDSAILAGYSKNRRVASVTASRLVKNPQIASLITEVSKSTVAKAGMDRAELLNEYAFVGRARPDLEKLTYSDKNHALDSLAKISGLMQQDQQFQQNVFNIAIVIDGGNGKDGA